MLTPDTLQEKYSARRHEIEKRLDDFARISRQGDDALLSELSFCICAANSSAEAASKAQRELVESGLLFSQDAPAVSAVLLSSGVRFHKNKAKYLMEARKELFGKKGLEKTILTHEEPTMLRNALADEISGLGMKEAGHFLRNTGLATEVAILDRHILKNMAGLGIIARRPKTLTRKRYIAIEKKMQRFCEKSGIPMAHLDLLMWSEETGRIFK